jgi:hypothetical protein
MLKNVVQELQQVAQQNPLAEAEKVKAQNQLLLAQIKQQQVDQDNAIKVAELASKDRLENRKIDAQAEQHRQDMTVDLTELALQHDTNLPGDLKKDEQES